MRRRTAALSLSCHMGWKQESLVVGQIRSSRKWISKISEGLGGPGLSWLIREALSATPASGWGGRECCYKLAGMSQIEPLPAQPPCVLTRCCVLGCSSLAAAGRRVPPHKATADLPPPFLPRLRLENHSKCHGTCQKSNCFW